MQWRKIKLGKLGDGADSLRRWFLSETLKKVSKEGSRQSGAASAEAVRQEWVWHVWRRAGRLLWPEQSE